ncbi:MAG: hypothetical protein ACYTFI_08250, partial [Planctomycetota bacterium]
DDDVAISPYYGPAIDRKHLDERVFVGWPRGPKWGKHYCVALTHVVDWQMHERTRNTITRVFLLGMTDAATDAAKAKALVPLARSWLRAPGIKATGAGCESLSYDRKEKAYVIRKDPKALVVWLKMESTKPVKIRIRPGRRVGR